MTIRQSTATPLEPLSCSNSIAQERWWFMMNSSCGARLFAALQSWQRVTMAGTKAGRVQSRPLFAGLPSDPRAIGSRRSASTVHVACPSRHRGWRSTRAGNHQRACVTLYRCILSSKAHLPLTASSPGSSLDCSSAHAASTR